LIVELADYAESRIEIALQKKIPSLEDLNPNTKFIDNLLIRQIRENAQLNAYLAETKLSWVNSPELIKRLHSRVRLAPYFKEYLEDPNRGFEQDKKLVIQIFTQEFVNMEGIFQTLEEQSIYWNDEVEFVISMIAKTLKGFKAGEGSHSRLMPLFKNDEDKEFAQLLFRKVILRKKEFGDMVESFTENWDVERITYIDLLILEMAITEAVSFPSIPTRVTINEYLEIAKLYSTEKSSVFINGLLDKILKHLKQEKIIIKTGRGLIGE
jgi:N utilization substance protein B